MRTVWDLHLSAVAPVTLRLWQNAAEKIVILIQSEGEYTNTFLSFWEAAEMTQVQSFLPQQNFKNDKSQQTENLVFLSYILRCKIVSCLLHTSSIHLQYIIISYYSYPYHSNTRVYELTLISHTDIASVSLCNNIKPVLPCLNLPLLLLHTGELHLSNQLCFMICRVSPLTKGQTTATAGPHPGSGISPAPSLLWLLLRLQLVNLLKLARQWVTHSR